MRARLADAERALHCHEGAPVAIVVVDSETRIVAANSMARTLLDLATNAPPSLDTRVAGSSTDELRVLVKAALAGTSMRAELTLSGEERGDVRLLVTAIAHSSSQVTCALVELPRYAHDALANLHAFANGLTHELNNKLQGVTANIELAIVEGPELQSELLADALGAAESIAALSAHLSAYASGQTLARRPLDLSTMVRVLEPVARSHAGTASLGIEVCDALEVHGDVAQLSRAVLSLVEHARDAGAERITIALSTWDATLADIAALGLAALPAGRYAVIAVRDNRRGVPTPPARFDVAETIVRGHRGALTVAPLPTGGVAARILLPRR